MSERRLPAAYRSLVVVATYAQLVLAQAGCAAPQSGSIAGGLEARVASLNTPPGIEVSLYAAGIDNARQMTLGDRGTIFVGSRGAGKVHAVLDTDGDQQADVVYLIDDGLDSPSGLAFREGSLYVAAVDRILRYDDVEDHLDDPPGPVVVNQALPGAWHHGWRYLKFGPDGWLYVAIGAPCNACDDVPIRNRLGWGDADPNLFATISRIPLDGTDLQPYAFGIRNSVGFDWQPGTNHLTFTDNGRDNLGDDLPPDELNVATEPGQHFGFPYCHGGDIADPQYGKNRNCAEFRPPAQKLGPHVASIGMTFITGDHFPTEYHGRAVIAEHGSWNRSEPIGYRVTSVALEGDQGTSYQTLIDGWLLENGSAWGRPSDVLQLPDGSLLVADDRADAIYRVSYSEPF